MSEVTMLKCIILLSSVAMVTGSGTLMVPPSRGVMWKEGFNTSTNFNYMQLNCGGVKQDEIGERQCGVCGDGLNDTRHHEMGNTYGTRTIGRYYKAGVREMTVKVELLAYEKGFFEFRICPANEKPVTQECLNQNLLPIKEGYLAGLPMRYSPGQAGEILLTIAIPPNMTCDRCVLQWRYRTANTKGYDPVTNTERTGKGPQEEFYNCADIRIGGEEPLSVKNNPFIQDLNAGSSEVSTGTVMVGGEYVVNQTGVTSFDTVNQVDITARDRMILNEASRQAVDGGRRDPAITRGTEISLQGGTPSMDVPSGTVNSQSVTATVIGPVDGTNIVITDTLSTASVSSDIGISQGQDQYRVAGTNPSNNVMLGVGVSGQSETAQAGDFVKTDVRVFDGLSGSKQNSVTAVESGSGITSNVPNSVLYTDGGTGTRDNSGKQIVIDTGLAVENIQPMSILNDKTTSISVGDASSSMTAGNSVSLRSGASDTVVNIFKDTTSTSGLANENVFGVSPDNAASLIYTEPNNGAFVNTAGSSNSNLALNVNSQDIATIGTGDNMLLGRENTQTDNSIQRSVADFRPVGDVTLEPGATGVDTIDFRKSTSIHSTNNVQHFPAQISVDKSTANTLQAGISSGINAQGSASLLSRDMNVNGLVSGGEVEAAKTFMGMTEFRSGTVNSNSGTLFQDIGKAPATQVIDLSMLDTGLPTGGIRPTFVPTTTTHQLNPSFQNSIDLNSPTPSVAPLLNKPFQNTRESIIFNDLSKLATMSTVKTPLVSEKIATITAPIIPPTSSIRVSESVGLSNTQPANNIQVMSLPSSVDSNIGQWSLNLPPVDPTYFDTINTDPSLLPSPITKPLNDITVKSIDQVTDGTMQLATDLNTKTAQQNIHLGGGQNQLDTTIQGQMSHKELLINRGAGTAALPDRGVVTTVEMSGNPQVTTQLIHSDGPFGQANVDMSSSGAKTLIPFEIIDPSTKVASIENINVPSPTLGTPIVNPTPPPPALVGHTLIPVSASTDIKAVVTLNKKDTLLGAALTETKNNVIYNLPTNESISSIKFVEKTANLNTGTVVQPAMTDPYDTSMTDPFKHLPAQSLAVIPLEPGEKTIGTDILTIQEAASSKSLDTMVTRPGQIVGGVDSGIGKGAVELNMISANPTGGPGFSGVFNVRKPLTGLSKETFISGNTVKDTNTQMLGISPDRVVDLRGVNMKTTTTVDKGALKASIDLTSGNLKNGNVVREVVSIGSSKNPTDQAVALSGAVSSGNVGPIDFASQRQTSGSIVGSGSTAFAPMFRFVRDPVTGMMNRVQVGQETNLKTREQDQIRVNSIKAALERRQMGETGRSGMGSTTRISSMRGIGSFPPEYIVEGAGASGRSGVRIDSFRDLRGMGVDGTSRFRGRSDFRFNPFSPFGDASVRRPIFPFGIDDGRAGRRVSETRSIERTGTSQTRSRPGLVPPPSGRSAVVGGGERGSRTSRTESRTLDTRAGTLIRPAVRASGSVIPGIGPTDRRSVSMVRRPGDFGSAAAFGDFSRIDRRGGVPVAGRVLDMGGVPIVDGAPAMMGGATGMRIGGLGLPSLPFRGAGGVDMGRVFRPAIDTGFFPVRPFMPFRTRGAMPFPMTPML